MQLPLTCEGGCHCGRVRFRVVLREDEAIDCNCSVCRKKGFLHAIVPPEDFTLLSGDEDLVVYTFNTGVAKHKFCRVCGIHAFYTPRSHPHMVDVNVHALDGDVAHQLKRVPFDGDNWEANVDAIR